MSADLDRYIEGENLRAKSLLEAFGYIVIPREAATALEAKDKELAALRENNEHAAGHLIDLLARAETAERRVAELEEELVRLEDKYHGDAFYENGGAPNLWSTRALAAERERDRIADELDTMNNNHRVMAKLLADTGCERDEAREALKPFAQFTEAMMQGQPDNRLCTVGAVTMGVMRRAARAITGGKL